MGDALIHRGPDARGEWWDTEAGIGLAHRRLAIVDVSEAGIQPMVSESGRYVMVYNGEVYNHLEIRACVEARRAFSGWRGHSDTETLLAAFEIWGIEDTFRRSVGMFAAAIWDADDEVLTLIRDRLGEKPLYYGWQGDALLFGSELKALKTHPSFRASISREAVKEFMRLGYVPGPGSIYQGIRRLQPGTLLRVSRRNPDPAASRYWSMTKVLNECRASNTLNTAVDAAEQLEEQLLRTVAQQMIADVPLGAFLSGGLDSSLVVALMQAQSSRPVKTFSVGVTSENLNEAEHAKAVACHLGTDHTELYVTADQALSVVPDLPAIYDEPFGDSSQIPMVLVSRLASREVTVALSGDGGDELFAGYNRHRYTHRFWNWLRSVPAPMRSATARAILSVSPRHWQALARRIRPLGSIPSLSDKVRKTGEVLASRSIDELYRELLSQHSDPAALVIEQPVEHSSFSSRSGNGVGQGAAPGLEDVEQIMLWDLLGYLPDDVLTKVDRAAMSVSLESRIPFLDHRVVELVWRMPLALKLREGQTKWLLRQILYKYVPRSLVDRPKRGFDIPLDEWLRGPLRPWAEELLSALMSAREPILEGRLISQMWREHQVGRRNWSQVLWSALTFQSWIEHNS